jgi:hypothetical protein
MNSNANTVELTRGLNICLADGRQPTTADQEKCAYTRWILLHIYIYTYIHIHICIHIQKRNAWHILFYHIIFTDSLKKENKFVFFSFLFARYWWKSFDQSLDTYLLPKNNINLNSTRDTNPIITIYKQKKNECFFPAFICTHIHMLKISLHKLQNNCLYKIRFFFLLLFLVAFYIYIWITFSLLKLVERR